MALPGAKVDRTSFLASQLSNCCDGQQVSRAIQRRPASAGISPDLIDKLADSCIRSHVLKASSISFAAGLPGGFAMAGTIPVDVAQFYWHALVLAQKLAYLYGWPDLLEKGEVDEQTELQLTLLVGAMMGAAAANRGLAELAKRFAGQVAHRLPRQALTKTTYYPIVKQVGKWIGIAVTKRGYYSSLSECSRVAFSVANTSDCFPKVIKRGNGSILSHTFRVAQEGEGKLRIMVDQSCRPHSGFFQHARSLKF